AASHLDGLHDDARAREGADAVLHDDDLARVDGGEAGGRGALAARSARHQTAYLVEAIGVDDVVVEVLVASVDDQRDVVDERELLVGLEDVGEDRLAVHLDELLRDEAAGEPAAAAAGQNDGGDTAGDGPIGRGFGEHVHGREPLEKLLTAGDAAPMVD